jgi:hypothetical protein
MPAILDDPRVILDRFRGAYSLDVVLSRRWSAFLVLFAVWSWVIWPRFAVAIWADPRSWSAGPTGFLLVHAVLIVASLAAGTVLGILGVRGWRAASRH